MHLSPNETRSIRSTLRDEYEEGYFKPTAATEIRTTVEPEDIATVTGEQIAWAKAGTGTIRTEVVDAAGVVTPVGSIPLVCGDTVTRLPAMIRTVMVDE